MSLLPPVLMATSAPALGGCQLTPQRPPQRVGALSWADYAGSSKTTGPKVIAEFLFTFKKPIKKYMENTYSLVAP